jgi:Domain of unknown function (DUF4424)
MAASGIEKTRSYKAMTGCADCVSIVQVQSVPCSRSSQAIALVDDGRIGETRICSMRCEPREFSWRRAIHRFLSRLVLIAAMSMPSIAGANDSSAELALGGLQLVRSDNISMDSEELFISTRRIRIRYRFTNRSATDIQTYVVFPLPDVSLRDAPGDQLFDGDYNSALDFFTKVDGVQIAVTRKETAILEGRDVSALLLRHGIPPLMPEAVLAERLRNLDSEARQELIREGLIAASGAELRPDWQPQWSIRTHVSRMQTFPAGRTVTVEHSYRPITGSSVAGALERSSRIRLLRTGGDAQELFARFCINNAFLRRFDRGGDRVRQPSGAYRYAESYVGYVLRTGANWRGPIRRFRLVVELERPRDLIATCFKGLRRTSPTQWGMVRRNYMPSEDLHLVFIHWGRKQPQQR